MNLHDPSVKVTSPDQALQYLKEGNKRFVDNATMPRDTNKADLAATAGQQSPFAVVLTCSDSRVSPEIYFDQKIGDIFVIRNAGNYADQEALGSLEFAVAALGAQIVVVVGHTMCGAVFNSFDKTGGLPANLTAVLDNIRVNIESCPSKEAAVGVHATAMADVVKANEVIKAKNTPVYSAVYDIATGVVAFQ